MKNKNGFTLVELIAVIAIILLIAVIAMPSLSNMYSRKDEENKDRVIENIENAAEVYTQMNNFEIAECKCIKISTLINDGVISTKQAKDLDINITNHYVKVIKQNNLPYKYEYCEECSNCN